MLFCVLSLAVASSSTSCVGTAEERAALRTMEPILSIEDQALADELNRLLK